jgi:hypothetical protein
MTWLKQCDLFVAEVSGSSFGLGFETGYLVGDTEKKVILSAGRRNEDISSDHWHHAPELQLGTVFASRRSRGLDYAQAVVKRL